MTDIAARPWLIVAGTACATMFVMLAASVDAGALQQADAEMRRRQRHPKRGPARQAALAVTALGYPMVQLPLAAALSLGLHRAGVSNAPRVFAAACTVFIADKSCKAVVARRRPPGYRGDEKTQSFPSGHTASTTAVALTAAILVGRARLRSKRAALAGAAVASLVMGESRLLLDDHWPSDVFAGLLLGCGTALLVTAPRAIRAPRIISPRLRRSHA